jgi:predicted phosphoribosyltransferase
MYWLFQDRKQAGEALAAHLVGLGWARKPPGRVFGLVRGGVAVAEPVARRLAVGLEPLVVCKIGAPENEEFGVGALTEDGIPIFSHDTMRILNLKPEDLLDSSMRKRIEAEEKIRKYRGAPLDWSRIPRLVLVVDDGLATGITAEAAVRYLRRMGVSEIALAVPVAAADSADALEKPGEIYDQVIALERVDDLGAIGSWYEDFSSVDDEQVLELLKRKESGAA